MSLVCAQCSRVNPDEAAYCFYDGAALAGRAGGPINAGSAPFPNQFVFPNGQACRNFDQLAVACQQHWPQAIDLLKQGFLGSFFGGLGRVDLAMAAQEALKFPDIDRGLDQLLAKLPTQAVQEPKLQAEPSEINIGVLKIGQDRVSELHLTNLGMRLVYGTVTSDCKWLTVGDGAGHSEKLFQFGSDTVMPIHVRGQHLRAGSKPLEGHLIVDSNGGTVTVTVKVDVPITPYAGGLFAGATTPRQIAEKAKANPKDAAPSFESGAIAKWYASNGWPYPVQGPTMSGMGAIQQFFEALGVAKAPKVEFAPQSLDLQGAVGKTVEATIEITTAERKVVYGWAISSVDWIEVGQTKLSGKSATVPITIRVPSPCPPKLETVLQLVGNGGQKLTVPITVKVVGGKAGVALKPSESEIRIEQDVASTPKKRSGVDAPAPLPTPNMMLPTPATSGSPFSFDEPATGGGDPSPFAVTESSPTPISRSRTDSGSSSDIAKPKPGMPLIVRLMLYLLPLAMLFVVILVLLIHDFFFAKAGNLGGGTTVTEGVVDMKEIDTRPHILIRHNEGLKDKEDDDHMTFAVFKIDPIDKDAPKVKLNYYENGGGNSVMLLIDNKPGQVFGHNVAGDWLAKTSKKAGQFGDGRTRTFNFRKDDIHVSQTVTLEPSDPDPNIREEKKRLLNTCLARYKITNKSKNPHSVSMRILIDGSIGGKDDVPFTIPGSTSVVTTFKDLRGKEVPDFVECMENDDIAKPGTVVRIGLKISDKFEAPDRFLLTRYPGKELGGYKQYEVPKVAFIGDPEKGDGKFGGDSCFVMYWDKKELKPGESREMGFTYGLGSVTVGGSGKLALTVGGRMFTGGELTVVALVADPTAKTATLELPPGLEHIDPAKKTQPIEKVLREGRPSPVTWQVRATRDGEHLLRVTTDSGLTNQRKVKISAKSLFN